MLPFSSISLIKRHGTPEMLNDGKVRTSILFTRVVYAELAAIPILALGVVLTALLPFGSAIRMSELGKLNKPQDWSFDRARTLLSVITETDNSKGTEAQVWSIASLGQAKRISKLPAEAARLSPDGKFLALMREGKLYLLAAGSPAPSPLPMPLVDFSGKERAEGPKGTTRNAHDLMKGIVFSHDGKWLLVLSSDKTVSLFDTDRGKSVPQSTTIKSKDIEKDISWGRISIATS